MTTKGDKSSDKCYTVFKNECSQSRTMFLDISPCVLIKTLGFWVLDSDIILVSQVIKPHRIVFNKKKLDYYISRI